MDAQQIAKILIRERASVHGFIWGILRDHHWAEDVFQEVTALAIDKAAEINDEAHLLSWSRTAARLKSMEMLRKKKKARLLDEDVLEDLEATWQNGDQRNSSDELDYLQECLKTLTPRARRVLELKFAEGGTGSQVADALSIKVHSVYVALGRIYAALEECIRSRREGAVRD